jgi:ubiquitin C-terminal hydrolase
MEQKEEEINKNFEKLEIQISKNKLKDLFNTIDKTKQNIKQNNSKQSNKKIDTKKNQKQYEEYEKKTKPTKPDFTQQYLENGLIGLNQKNSFDTQYKGLTNFGNICYSNVVFQCLISLKEFVNMLKDIYEKLIQVEEINMDKIFPVFSHLVKIQNYYESK